MNSNRLSIVALLIGGLGPSALAESAEEMRERYLKFAAEGISDVQRVSNVEVWRTLRTGVESDDRRIVDLTLLALNNLTLLYVPEVRRIQVNPWNSDREINRVPGLKRFLINHWRAHAAGRDHEVPMTDIQRPEWFGPWPSEWASHDATAEEAKDKVWETFVHSTQWQLIPNVLATHWPGDPEVLSLIWEARDHHVLTVPDADPVAYAVGLFDRGKFDTSEVNALRETKAAREGRN